MVGWSWRRAICPKEVDIPTITAVAWGKELVNFWFFIFPTDQRLIAIASQKWCSKSYMVLRLFFFYFLLGPICPVIFKFLLSFIALFWIFFSHFLFPSTIWEVIQYIFLAYACENLKLIFDSTVLYKVFKITVITSFSTSYYTFFHILYFSTHMYFIFYQYVLSLF